MQMKENDLLRASGDAAQLKQAEKSVQHLSVPSLPLSLQLLVTLLVYLIRSLGAVKLLI